MQGIYVLLAACIFICACASSFYCIFGIKIKKNYGIQGVCISVLLLAVLYIIQKLIPFQVVYWAVAALIWCLLLFDETPVQKMKVFLITIVAFQVVGSVVTYFVEIFLGDNYRIYNVEFIADSFLSISIWIKYALYRKTINIREFKKSMYWALVAAMLFSSLMVAGCTNGFADYITGIEQSLLLFFISGIGLAFCIMMVMIFYIIHRNHEYNILLKEQEKYQRYQKQYYLKLLEKEEDTRKFRHDIANHLLVIHAKAKEEGNEQIRQYIEEMQGELYNIQKKNYDVGNELVNAILNYYFADKDKKIEIYGSFKRAVWMEETDLCVIISNLARNVIQHADWKEQVIFRFKQGKDSLLIETCNTAKNHIELDSVTELPKMSKQDKENHGFGLQNIKSVVEKNHGRMEFKIQGKKVIIRIAFNGIDR